DVVGVATLDVDHFAELVDRALLDAVLAEHRQDVRDVVHEHGVRPDDEHTGPLELRPMRIEKPRRSVQPDRGLAGAGTALDHEYAVRVSGNQPVLVRLDRRDDVAHTDVARTLELFEQDVRDAVDDVARGTVERLVVEVEQLTSRDPEAP